MFCNQCGGPLQSDYRLCPRCGSAVSAMAVVPQQGRVERHIRVLAILWMIVAALFLIPAVAFLIAGSVAHAFIPMSDAVGRALGPFVLHVFGATFLLVAVGGMCVAWGLIQRRPWARIVALVLGFLAVLHPPLGTALGIYTLWVLLPADAEREYSSMAGMA